MHNSKDNEILSIEQIPVEVIKELEANYKLVSFETYGHPFTPECKTMSNRFIQSGDLLDYGLGMDPETFAPVILENIQEVTSFKIRGVFSEDKSKIDVYSVSTIKAIKSSPDTIVHKTTDPDYNELLIKVKQQRESGEKKCFAPHVGSVS